MKWSLLVSLLIIEAETSVLQCRLQSSDVVSCHCTKGERDKLHTFTWGTVQELSLKRVILTKCSNLILQLLPPVPSPLPELVVNNIGRVEIWQSQASPHLNITLNKAERVRMVSEALLETGTVLEAKLLYGLIISSSILVVLLLAALALVLSRSKSSLSCWSHSQAEVDPDIKKVSRAASWKFQRSQGDRFRQKSLPPLPQAEVESRVRHNTYSGDITYRQPQAGEQSNAQ